MNTLTNYIKANPRYSVVTFLFVSSVAFCIFAPRLFDIEPFSKYSVQITVGYWLVGLIFLMFHKFRYMLLSFECCAAMCLFLQVFITPSTTPTALLTQEPIIKIGQFNLGDSKSNPNETLKAIKKTNADIISLQEVSFDWYKQIEDTLNETYPYHCKLNNADIYSIDIFSRYPFERCDTILCSSVPILALRFRNTYIGGQFFIISTYIAPPLYKLASQVGKMQLDSISDYCMRQKSPAIILGDYNLHTTSPQIMYFREKTHIIDSRKGYRLERDDGHISLFDIPTDYIFHSPHFNCISFKTVDGPSREHLGIYGEYQINADSIKRPATFKEGGFIRSKNEKTKK